MTVFSSMRHSLWLRGKQGVDYCQQVCLLLSTVRAAVVNRAVDSSQHPVFVVRKNNSPYGKTSFSPVLLLYKLPGKGCFAIGRQLYRPFRRWNRPVRRFYLRLLALRPTFDVDRSLQRLSLNSVFSCIIDVEPPLPVRGRGGFLIQTMYVSPVAVLNLARLSCVQSAQLPQLR